MIGRLLRQRRTMKAVERTLDALADEFGGTLRGIDTELTRDAGDWELAQAIAAAGGVLLCYIASVPLVKQITPRTAGRAIKDRPRRVVAASEFLAHALVRQMIDSAEFEAEFAERLDYEAPAPYPVELRALAALRAHLPIPVPEEEALDAARVRLHHAKELFRVNEDLDVQTAIGFRKGAYKLDCAKHALHLLVLAETPQPLSPHELEPVKHEVVSTLTVGGLWQHAERRVLETLRTVA